MSFHDFLFVDRYDLWDMGIATVCGICIGIALIALKTK
jgi:hypothetical protein